MTIGSILLIAIGLSMDALAVAIASGIVLGSVSRRQLFRLSFHFGLFQAGMPVLGWLTGQTFASRMTAFDHWIAFGLLGYVGGKALYQALQAPESLSQKTDPTRGMSLVTLSVATSIDAFAVGFSFALLDVVIWYPCAIIGFTTALVTMFGMLMGGRLGMKFGRRVEIIGGLVLIGIGTKILIQHLMM